MAVHRLSSRRTLADQVAALRKRVAELEAERDRLNAENHDLVCRLPRLAREVHEARVDLGGAIEDRRYAAQTADALREQHAAAVAANRQLRAQAAQRDAVTVPPMVRDTSDPADIATAPIPVPWPTGRTHHVIPLHQRP